MACSWPSILNSKSEYNRCHIPRLVVEREDEGKREQRLSMEKKNREGDVDKFGGHGQGMVGAED